MEIKTIVKQVEDNFIKEVIDDSLLFLNKTLIGKYENSIEGYRFNLYYVEGLDTTILESYDGHNETVITYKTKIDPNHMVLYHLYLQIGIID